MPRAVITRAAIAAVVCLTSAVAFAGPLYRWVDENGQVHYGDRIPPRYAKQQRDELNDRGVVVESRERQKTAEEAAAAAEAERQAAAEAAAAEEQARYDRYLLTSYNSVADLMAQRDERLTMLDSRLELARKSVADTEATLTRLNERRDKLETADKPVPDKLKQQIGKFEASLVTGLRTVSALETEQTETREQFTDDIERYLELKNRNVGSAQ